MTPVKGTNNSDDKIEMFDVEDSDINACSEWIRQNRLERVCLQFPDQLLFNSAHVVTKLEKITNNKIYILGDTTCGSCCVDEIAAQHIKGDSVVHFGHACLNPTIRLPVFYIFPKKKIDVTTFYKKFQQTFIDFEKKIIFFYDVAYAHCIEQIHNALKQIYKQVIFTSLNCTSSIPFVNSQNNSSHVVLGRILESENDLSWENSEAFFLGSNEITMTTLAMGIPVKKWYYYENDAIIELGTLNTPWLKRRRFLVEKLKDAKTVGIVVATLGIKEYLKAIDNVKAILRKKNKKVYIISVGKINPVKLANFAEIDAFVVITCSENEIFSSKEFLKPLLLPFEVDLAFNKSREYSAQYIIDFRQILPGGLNYVQFEPSTESDVSLISGELRPSSESNEYDPDKMTSLVLPGQGTVAIGKAGAEFLQTRSWKGVEQRLGQDPVKPAEMGRSGLAACYKNEYSLDCK